MVVTHSSCNYKASFADEQTHPFLDFKFAELALDLAETRWIVDQDPNHDRFAWRGRSGAAIGKLFAARRYQRAFVSPQVVLF
jgi:hypothetical protein